ncbi:MAG TPA: pyridoxamine 5'-phosphate oxidase family protein [Noviherbaspirillum sp.]|uniref:HugZ family pyridoxamine 5'-phosphate oxidase n=1 Tax=Noviherbaspirillum sp. TaxID=1926288 RepID=UPI002B497840|nr:pyridoxamine 5'-phosphate oxidase family protein [Noviherbaspirillum sp.]HJV84945.1 pyridoxamine 5'-phosphate oxidase family protein [Noviherbaspirillum sp.]
MKPTPATALQLLHRASSGALATHATQMPGYPFATALPFVPDELHRPVFLVSTLAEHTKNLVANPHASFLLTDPQAPDVLDAPRMTIIGDATRLEPSPGLVARFVRYQPQAEQYLALGDFSFYALSPKRVRYIAGFAKMGWIEESEWFDVKPLALAEEARLVTKLDGRLPTNIRVLGIDRYGIDLIREGVRERKTFSGPLPDEELARELEQLP